MLLAASSSMLRLVLATFQEGQAGLQPGSSQDWRSTLWDTSELGSYELEFTHSSDPWLCPLPLLERLLQSLASALGVEWRSCIEPAARFKFPAGPRDGAASSCSQLLGVLPLLCEVAAALGDTEKRMGAMHHNGSSFRLQGAR